MASTNPIKDNLTADEYKQLQQCLETLDDLDANEPEYTLGYEQSAKEWQEWQDKRNAVIDENSHVTLKAITALIKNYNVNEDNNGRGLIELVRYFLENEQNDEQTPAGLLNTSYLPMMNNNSINGFRTLTKSNFKNNIDEFTRTATYTDKKGVKYSISEFDKLQGELGTSAKKIMDTAILYLTATNYRHTLSRASVEIPLIEYGEANGYNLTARKMPTKEEQDAENNRVNDRLKDFKKRLRRDLTNLRHFEFSRVETRGKDAGNCDVGGIISSFHITNHNGKQVIQINFDVEMAQYFLDSYVMQYPTVLLKHRNQNINGYAIGCKIALQSSIDNNIAKGTDYTLKVKTLLESAPDIKSIETLRAQKQRNWKEKIKDPLEAALNSNVEIGFITYWEYRDPRTEKKYTSETAANMLTWDEYNNLDVRFELMENPEKEARIAQKGKERVEAEKEKEAAADASNHQKKTAKKTRSKNAVKK